MQQTHSHPSSLQMLPKNATIRFKGVIATLGGIGFLPKMPGTFGSAAVALLVMLCVAETAWIVRSVLFGIACVAFLLGLWAVPALEKYWGNDPACVVLDEVVGMSLTLISPLLPFSFGWTVLGFILFRVFDITKPFPISRINARTGAFFVMFDDVIASLYALVVLHGIWLISQLLGFQ
ncbi:MAG: phosphatidylglycerophosphatase A [Candidatus Kapaibacterium sp.]|nr:MAG: phosphatidylglycerophosphatase A [Candidatus Kapabacteria bacterium]